MNWFTVIDAAGDLFALVAAVLTLIAAKRNRDKK